MESRTIGVDEANRMLPLLGKIIEDVMAHWELIIQKRTQLECMEKGLDPSGKGPAPNDPPRPAQGLKTELNHLIDKINCYIREVEELGCFVEEFKRGIVNFPSLYNGRKVFLCWRPDETRVSHWHELDETFNERVPIRDTGQFLTQQPRVR
ncbi:MAG: DUF2203 domain-containing protein [Planctomycetota bacterium]|nr:DUF2203 domain-containing protein [Planctomycetota bacterium]